MGKELIESGNALDEGNQTTVTIPANLQIKSLVILLQGSDTGTALPVDDIAEVRLKRQLPGEASRTKVQEADLSLIHRASRYERFGDVVYTNSGGGTIDVEAVLDQFVPTRPDNVLHTANSEEARLILKWGDLSNASALSYSVFARTDKSATESYLRRIGTADLQMSDGVTKKRDTGENLHKLYLLNKDGVIADEGIDVEEKIGSMLEEHFTDLSFADVERANQKDLPVDDSGIMDAFTRLQIAESARLSEHVNDGAHYEIEGSGDGTVKVVHDRIDLENAYNSRSANQQAQRQQGRVTRTPRPATSATVEQQLMQQ